MPRRTASVALTLLLALLVGGLTACGSLADPDAVQTRLPSVSASPTPTAATPDLSDPVVQAMPAAARVETEEGAEAFAGFFVEQLGAFYSDTQVVDFDELYTSDCKECRIYDRGLTKLRKTGKTRTNPAKVTFSGAEQFTPVTRLVQVAVTFKRLTIYKSGKPVAEIGKGFVGNLQFRLDLEFDGRWRVSEMDADMSAFQD